MPPELLLTPGEYAKKRGLECPRCHSHDLEGAEVEIDAGWATQDIICNECHSTWTDLYTLAGYRSLDPEEAPEPFTEQTFCEFINEWIDLNQKAMTGGEK